MSSPYSGATPTGAHAGDTQSIPVVDPQNGNYAVTPDYQGQPYAGEPHVSGDMGTPMTADGRPDIEGTSVGQLLGEVSKDLSTLMRQELELAKAEMKVEAKKAGQGAGMFGAAGLAGLMTVIFLSIALWWALSHLVGHSWSALIVAVLWAIIGAVTFTMGKKKFQQVNPKPER